MNFTPQGKHLIAGEWVGSDQSFENEPLQGSADRFSMGTVDLADRAVFLNGIANEIKVRGADITEIGCRETGLPEARLTVSVAARPGNCACSPKRSLKRIIWTGGTTRTVSRCHARTYAQCNSRLYL